MHPSRTSFLHASRDISAVSLLMQHAAVLRASSWSRRARRALEDIAVSYAPLALIRKQVPWSLEVGLGPGFDGALYDAPPGRKVVRAGLHFFEAPHTTFVASLLGENMVDSQLFRELGLMKLAQRGWEAVGRLRHEPRGTGGSTFAPEFRSLANQGRILLAIADADRRYPSSGYGRTYDELQAEAARRPGYQRARCTYTRTAEGLIPLAVYCEVFQAKGGDPRVGSLARLAQMFRSAPSDVVQYAHLKDGITVHQIENPKTEAEGVYWRDVARKVRRDQCTQPSTKRCTRRQDCRCYVVDPLGDRALADVVTWLATRKSKKELAARFDLATNHDLSALADEILSWGLALPALK